MTLEQFFKATIAKLADGDLTPAVVAWAVWIMRATELHGPLPRYLN